MTFSEGDNFHFEVERIAKELERLDLEEAAASVRSLRCLASDMMRELLLAFSAIRIIVPTLLMAWTSDGDETLLATFIWFGVVALLVAILYVVGLLTMRVQVTRRWPKWDR